VTSVDAASAHGQERLAEDRYTRHDVSVRVILISLSPFISDGLGFGRGSAVSDPWARTLGRPGL